jgi:hypothetical protein
MFTAEGIVNNTTVHQRVRKERKRGECEKQKRYHFRSALLQVKETNKTGIKYSLTTNKHI